QALLWTASGWKPGDVSVGPGPGPGGETPVPQKVAILADLKPSGTGGGSSVVGWQDRTLNTKLSDNYNLVTLTNDKEFTLTAGTYLIEWSAPSVGSGPVQTRLTNVTSGATETLGSSVYSGSANTDLESVSAGSWRVNINTNTTYKIEHRITYASGSINALGTNGNTGLDNIYTQVTITDLSIVGGTGTAANTNIFGTAKAWGSVAADGAIDGTGFNVASITKTDTGTYEVVFTTPMPNADYAVSGSVNGNIISGTPLVFKYGEVTATGFTVATCYTQITSDVAAHLKADLAFSFAVHNNEPAEISLSTFGDVINYSGAAAWGDVAADGTLNSGLNVASVTRTGTGMYNVVFTTPMPTANYAIVGSVNGSNSSVFFVANNTKTVTGFTYGMVQSTNGSQAVDGKAAFTVDALNALPPKGGTGTDAWGNCAADGTINASFNVASVTRAGTGLYDVAFTTPMPTSSYAVQLTAEQAPGLALNGIVGAKTTNGFRATIYKSADGTVTNGAFDFTVNATNATLPATVTQEQIESAINNPGASAWGNFNGSSGVTEPIRTSLNVASVTRTGTGKYDVVFATPMPSEAYSVQVTSTQLHNVVPNASVTATGFSIETRTGDAANNLADSSRVSFTVFATNALPPRGGTGTDCWGSYNKDTAALDSSFNCTLVKNSTGDLSVTFVTPMPTANYSVTAAVSSANNALIRIRDKTVNGFRITTGNVSDTFNSFVNCNLDFQVNATNAQLPDTFTIEQFNDLVARVTALENA
ncbi:MAG: hypothetical protein GY881_11000, partial [Gammaproteobacteria bacterium]|nr:hypothetical protein [Gammaproteobacteria bacterium]